ncbi:NADH:flavin oxidoreductase [Paenibacillus sp. sptzw28]|uniref:oxidoreductase n=1 Tax=Paenibacillus sp. sptzw28 TaxID=715179 RepID=UPI001C6EE7F8|nr:NADH:flavin oxidoreductase [Paenibacillus sp. sptzw28]QYR23155.1 NADH:flavin oxidoreductase [Paenibacillus sp. sptzw28]
MITYSKLLSAFQLGSLRLHNRAVLSPMTRTSAECNGLANQLMVRYYTRFAKGGFGLIITEGIYPDSVNSQSYKNQPGLADKEQAESWRPVVEAVHREGGRIIAQLMHAGALVQHNEFKPIAPSAVKPVGTMLEEHGGSGEYSVPDAMSKSDIRQVIDNFAHAAQRAKQVGFDGVELHAANGYLLDQFITKYTNQRTDEYGGSTENRIRIVVELLDRIRSVVGQNYTVGVRISQGKVNDFNHKWANGINDAKIIFEKLGTACPTYIHTTEYKAFAPAFTNGGPTLAKLAATYGGLPVIANGKLGDPEMAEQLLASGEAELAAIGTSALVNPDWVNKVKEGIVLNRLEHQFLHPMATLREDEIGM